MTVDPVMTLRQNVADPQRWNRYAYARNNPLKYVDPDGRDWRLSASLTQSDMEFVRAAIAEAIRHPQARETFLALEADTRVIELRAGALAGPGNTGLTTYPARAGNRVFDTTVTFDIAKIMKIHWDRTGVVTFLHEMFHVDEALSPNVSYQIWRTGDIPLSGPGTMNRAESYALVQMSSPWDMSLADAMALVNKALFLQSRSFAGFALPPSISGAAPGNQ
jgi:hypothetical protein